MIHSKQSSLSVCRSACVLLPSIWHRNRLFIACLQHQSEQGGHFQTKNPQVIWCLTFRLGFQPSIDCTLYLMQFSADA